jgi:hypothetical protein
VSDYSMLRTWSVILYVLGFLSMVVTGVGIVTWAIDVAGVLRTVAVLTIGAPIVMLMATWPLAIGQALRAIADIGDRVGAARGNDSANRLTEDPPRMVDSHVAAPPWTTRVLRVSSSSSVMVPLARSSASREVVDRPRPGRGGGRAEASRPRSPSCSCSCGASPNTSRRTVMATTTSRTARVALPRPLAAGWGESFKALGTRAIEHEVGRLERNDERRRR